MRETKDFCEISISVEPSNESGKDYRAHVSFEIDGSPLLYISALKTLDDVKSKIMEKILTKLSPEDLKALEND